MSRREGRSKPAHMASSRKKKNKRPEESARAYREPLQDRYYYEEGGDDFEDLRSYSSAGRREEDRRELERQRPKKKMGRAKKVILITLALLVLLVGAGAWYVFGYMLKPITFDTQLTKDPIKLGVGETVSTVVENGDTEPFQMVMDDSIKNIAMFGVDARDDSFEGLSDVIMILTVDNKHGSIKMTSILRDSCVYIDWYGYNKINSAYALEGPELAIRTLNTNFHLDITDYVTVNFSRMAQIVDAVGGVDIELTWQEVREINRNLYALSRESYDDGVQIYASDYIPDCNGNAIIETDNYDDGVYHLNGNRAVAYGRIRHLAGGDDVRASRQQNVLKALIHKVKGKSKLEYPNMIRQIAALCKTSLQFDDIWNMLPIMFTDFEIETLTVPGEVECPSGAYIRPDCWVYLYDLEAGAKHISQFIYEQDSPYYGMEIYAGYPNIPTVAPPEDGEGDEPDISEPEGEDPNGEDPGEIDPNAPNNGSGGGLIGPGEGEEPGPGEDPWGPVSSEEPGGSEAPDPGPEEGDGGDGGGGGGEEPGPGEGEIGPGAETFDFSE